MDRPIGSEFDIGNYRYRVEEADSRKCTECDLFYLCRCGLCGLNMTDRYAGACSSTHRRDNKNVVFKIMRYG